MSRLVPRRRRERTAGDLNALRRSLWGCRLLVPDPRLGIRPFKLNDPSSFSQDDEPVAVYVLGSSQPWSKVGVSNSPESRCQSLQTGHPHRLRLETTVYCRNRNAAEALEGSLHAALRGAGFGAGLVGEWFGIEGRRLASEIDAVRSVIAEVAARATA